MPYNRLDPTHIIDTVDRLAARVNRRFPEAGLGKVCQTLLEIARAAQQRSEEIKRPNIALRVVSGVAVAIILVGLIKTLTVVQMPDEGLKLTDFLQVLEAGINDVVLIGAAIFFAVTLEVRIKRTRALRAIHELRSLAHIIDMHQLTKDPDSGRGPKIESADRSVVERDVLTPHQLIHYLDYCSEMLSLIGKIAALYVQRFDDPVALASVNEVESLTTGLSRKIWQKIMILHSVRDEADRGGAGKIVWLDGRREPDG